MKIYQIGQKNHLSTKSAEFLSYTKDFRQSAWSGQ